MYNNNYISSVVVYYNKFPKPQNLLHFRQFENISMFENGCSLSSPKTKKKSSTTNNLPGRQLSAENKIWSGNFCLSFWRKLEWQTRLAVRTIVTGKFNTKMSGRQCPMLHISFQSHMRFSTVQITQFYFNKNFGYK